MRPSHLTVQPLKPSRPPSTVKPMLMVTLLLPMLKASPSQGAIGGTLATNLITVSKTGANSAATFKAGVNPTAIVLGDGAGTGTNTVTFDGTTAGFTVAGTVNGTAGDTDNVVVSGGHTIVQSGVWGGVSALNGLTVSGSGTILDSNAAIERCCNHDRFWCNS
jgi:hypothetical protein